jgi:hypothetical protein
MIIPELLRNSPWREDLEIDRLVRLLLPPLDPNPQTGHPGLGIVWARGLQASAKAFEFDRDAWEAATALLATKARRLCIFDACRPPCSPAFFEITNSEGRTCGIFTEGDPTNCKITVVSIPQIEPQLAKLPAHKAEFVLGYLRVLPWFQMRVDFTADQMVKSLRCFSSAAQQHMETEIGNAAGTMNLTTAELYIGQVAALWSYLGTPGVATSREVVTREGRKAQRRGRFAPSVLHSYNEVTLNLPREIRAGDRSESSSPGPSRRFHDVMAFDRLRHAPPPGSPQLLRWLYAWWYGRVHVRAHHRGNPALGIIVKQRKITTQQT